MKIYVLCSYFYNKKRLCETLFIISLKRQGVLPIQRSLLPKLLSRPTFLAFILVFLVKIVHNIFLLDKKWWILKQRELINKLVKPYTEGVLRPPCCSFTDFYCQNIKGQFPRHLLQFFLSKLSKITIVVSILWCVGCFCLKIVFLLDTKGWILKQRELVNELVKAYSEGLLRPSCCSLTDFYCQTIQGQFSRRLLQFFLYKLSKISMVVSILWWVIFFCFKIKRPNGFVVSIVGIYWALAYFAQEF